MPISFKFTFWVFLCVCVISVFGIDPYKAFGNSTLNYCNPKYLGNCSVTNFIKVTNGVQRHMTNYSVVLLVPFGNNATTESIYVSQRGVKYKIEHKLCDHLKMPWQQKYMNRLSKAKLSCPLQPGLLEWSNLEVPAPNLPVPMVPGLYQMEGLIFRTTSKERIISVTIIINYPKKRKPKAKPKNKPKLIAGSNATIQGGW